MSKLKDYVYLLCAVAVLVVLSLILSFSGTKNVGYNYVKLEINPSIEFLCSATGKVVSLQPVNPEAKELIINEEFIGLNVSDAAKKFVELCTMAGYIDVTREDNSIKLTAVTKLTEALDVKIYKKIKSYLIENEIKAVIIENEQDLQEYKRAKKLGVSANKLSLMESVCNLYKNKDINKLKKLSKKELVNEIKLAHINNFESNVAYSETELENKTKRINENKSKINNHKQTILENGRGRFADEYKQFIKSKQKYYKQNFNKQRENWKLNKINSLIA